jgi:hypothetical protein
MMMILARFLVENRRDRRSVGKTHNRRSHEYGRPANLIFVGISSRGPRGLTFTGSGPESCWSPGLIFTGGFADLFRVVH